MGNVHVTELTISNNFPIANAIQASFGGICGFSPNTFSCPDVFVSKVSADGSMFTISTYLGGNNFDNGNGIAVDSAGNTYVTGSADSATFATTSGALQTVHAGQTDGFVSRIVTTLTVASSSLSVGNHAVGTTSAPLRSSCSVSPSSVTMDGTTTEDVTVRVTTTARSMVPPMSGGAGLAFRVPEQPSACPLRNVGRRGLSEFNRQS